MPRAIEVRWYKHALGDLAFCLSPAGFVLCSWRCDWRGVSQGSAAFYLSAPAAVSWCGAVAAWSSLPQQVADAGIDTKGAEGLEL